MSTFGCSKPPFKPRAAAARRLAFAEVHIPPRVIVAAGFAGDSASRPRRFISQRETPCAPDTELTLQCPYFESDRRAHVLIPIPP